MGLFDFFKTQRKHENKNQEKNIPMKLHSNVIRNSPNSYVDSSSISDDERKYYRPDDYYTYYSYPGTEMAKKVVTFEERKKISYPSERGLYVAEILLLDYCRTGKYPKPKGGYPGLWWFEYGIRDVGHALESLEKRGFIQWATKKESLKAMNTDALKRILNDAALPINGKKSELISRIETQLPDEKIEIRDYVPKYKLTELGKQELEDNGYVPYMHKHKYRTTEGDLFGSQFNVWSINKLLHTKNLSDWHKVVGEIELERLGVDMVNATAEKKSKPSHKKSDYLAKRDEMRKYLTSKQSFINNEKTSDDDGFQDGFRGIQEESIDQDREALVDYYIAIRKKTDIPAIYKNAAKILRKYGMYEEELEVIESGLKYIPVSNKNRDTLLERKKKVIELIEKEKSKS